MSHDTCQCTDNWAEVEAAARQSLGEEVCGCIDEILQTPNPQSQLITVLHKVQAVYGFLSQEHMRSVAQLLQVPAAKVTGVASFYHFFRLKPGGKFQISVCLGTACYVKGAERVGSKLQEELGIQYGETTSDMLFSLEATRCVGSCGLAPVIMVNEKVHAMMTPDKVPGLIEQYVNEAKAVAAN